MTRVCAIGAILAMTLGPVTASEAIAPERVEALVKVIEANGCRMSPHDADKVFPENGFADKTETKTITEMLIATERARILDGRLVLFGEACDTTNEYSGRERFFAGIADNGCVMTTKQATTILPKVGVDMQEVRLLMNRMMSMGEVQLSDDETTVYLEESLCESFKGLSATMAAAKPAPPETRSPEQLKADFVTLMRSLNCQMTRVQSQEILPEAGFKGKEMRPIIAKMIKEGEATMTGEDDLLVLSEEVCAQ